MHKSWIVTCLTNFLIAALMGVALRLTNVIPQSFDFAKLIHAHSHTAMLGWVYMMLYSLFVHYFVPETKRKKYGALFWITQVSVVGMMISFPIQGYALFSIAFSTMHILCSYVFCFRIWKDNNVVDLPVKRFLYTALVFMIVSTFGAWSLGIIVNLAGKDSPLYLTAIQFFLHFQFNGWFVFGVFSIFFAVIYRRGGELNQRRFRLFYNSLLLSSIVGFALPLSWHFPSDALFYTNIAGVALQVFSVFCFVRMFVKRRDFVEKQRASKWLLGLSLISFVIKTAMQMLAIHPAFAQASHTVRNFTVGFIHLGMLGVITGFLFFFLTKTEFGRNADHSFKTGISIFYVGFLLTEALLFAQGMTQFLKWLPIPNYPEILFGASILLPIGLLLILASVLSQKLRVV